VCGRTIPNIVEDELTQELNQKEVLEPLPILLRRRPSREAWRRSY
jgi:hypothetical protein